ncbi:MAG: DUF72 domain-containing protein [Ignavibacteriales bacterium]|nr:DUF72 domain-containing protein [Ignavibacteriales bacterium]
MKKITLNKTNIYFGTCSWKYDSWMDIVYTRPESKTMLAEYATHYSSVEIDQWFWSLHQPGTALLPKPKDVEDYALQTSGDFRFTIKAPNSITLTHFYQKNKSEPLKVNPHFLSAELAEKFIASIKPLQEKIGMIMFQFEYLNLSKMPSLEHFLGLLHEFTEKLPAGYPYGIEIRNPNYLNERYFAFLNEHNLSHVFLQGYFMPPVFPLIKSFQPVLHSPLTIRLHGPDRSGIEKKTGSIWNAIVEPKDEELHELVAMLIFLSSYQNDIYVNVNNHFEGSAPLTIKRISDLLTSELH